MVAPIFRALLEAALLSLLGAFLGLAIGLGVAQIIEMLYPVLKMMPPPWAIVAGMSIALLTGVLFGLLPARRAASLDAVFALTGR